MSSVHILISKSQRFRTHFFPAVLAHAEKNHPKTISAGDNLSLTLHNIKYERMSLIIAVAFRRGTLLSN